MLDHALNGREEAIPRAGVSAELLQRLVARVVLRLLRVHRRVEQVRGWPSSGHVVVDAVRLLGVRAALTVPVQ